MTNFDKTSSPTVLLSSYMFKYCSGVDPSQSAFFEASLVSSLPFNLSFSDISSQPRGMTTLFVNGIALIHSDGVLSRELISYKTISAIICDVTPKGDSKSRRENRSPSLSPREGGSLRSSGSTSEGLRGSHQ